MISKVFSILHITNFCNGTKEGALFFAFSGFFSNCEPFLYGILRMLNIKTKGAYLLLFLEFQVSSITNFMCELNMFYTKTFYYCPSCSVREVKWR